LKAGVLAESEDGEMESAVMEAFERRVVRDAISRRERGLLPPLLLEVPLPPLPLPLAALPLEETVEARVARADTKGVVVVMRGRRDGMLTHATPMEPLPSSTCTESSTGTEERK